ncbi:MAG: hypothetical protein KAW52_06505, partial [candidate division Zixibacteria bacterium]|nr:hypothetical protein [candidate division Zixibacteria bacterium]
MEAANSICKDCNIRGQTSYTVGTPFSYDCCFLLLYHSGDHNVHFGSSQSDKISKYCGHSQSDRRRYRGCY